MGKLEERDHLEDLGVKEVNLKEIVWEAVD
jgi:hypothetical protein